MISMDKIKQRVLKISEICDLIKICGENRVSKLKFADLEVLFAPNEIGVASDVITSNQSELVEQEAQIKDEVLTKEDEVAELLLTNPAEFERQLALGDLEDGHSRTEPAV